MCIMTFWDNIHQATLANQDTVWNWVGFADEHIVGIFQVLNTTAQSNCVTKSITFSAKSYGESNKVEKPDLSEIVMRGHMLRMTV